MPAKKKKTAKKKLTPKKKAARSAKGVGSKNKGLPKAAQGKTKKKLGKKTGFTKKAKAKPAAPAKKPANDKATTKVKVAELSKVAKIGPKKTTTIVQHVFLQATPEQVFEAWVNPAMTSSIIGGECTGEAKVGAPFTSWNGYIKGKHVELVPGERVVQEWTTTEWPKGAEPSRLELQLTGTGGGTEVTMTHSQVPSEQAEEYRQGWIDYFWTPMRAHFGG